MEELSTYRLGDFVPFTREVYDSVLRIHDETWWPLHILTVVLGGLGVLALLTRRPRVAGALLAAGWIWVGVSFHLLRYATILWAATSFGVAFVGQGVLVAVAGWRGHLTARETPAGRAGLLVAAAALALYPIAAAQFFGMHPDPTALATLGIALSAQRWQPALAVWPVSWLAVSGLTAYALG